ncbi:MAG: peptidase, partial [FCB group bacterium]|nr:peptidase [FCB group bacterium]
MSIPGYYRYPTIHKDTVVFVCEDDLWAVSTEGGLAWRLTASLGAVSGPCYSPDGKWLAFAGRDEGPWEIYVMPAEGGEVRRLTYQGSQAAVAGWTPDGAYIVYASNTPEHGGRSRWLWRISPEGGAPERLAYGKTNHVSFGPEGGIVIGRNTGDPATWKRYRGGTAGQLWIDRIGDGKFEPLVPCEGNLTAPMWIGDRIYLISDHEGIGNLYSCTAAGEDLCRHTHHEEYYCRQPRTDGRRIVYHSGADLYVYDIEEESCARVQVDLRSPRTQRQRRFVDPSRFFQEYSLHPDGQALSIVVRGKLFTMANWEGAVLQHGVRDGVRYRLPEWLNDGQRIVAVADTDGEEALEIHARDGITPPERLSSLDIGRALGLAVSPTEDRLILWNHRHELLLVDLEEQSLRLIDTSPYERIRGAAWSPDGNWIAYSLATTERTSSIKIARASTGESWMITPTEFVDVAPAWDPGGFYLYFLSYREFNPVYDDLHFDLGFPQAMRPLLVTLRKGLLNPFVPMPRTLMPEPARNNNSKPGEAPAEVLKHDETAPEEAAETAPATAVEPEPPTEEGIAIDFDGIQQRVIAFPYPEGHYGQIAGIDGRVLLTSYPIEGSLGKPSGARDNEPRGSLLSYDLREQRKDTLGNGVSFFTLSRDCRIL